MIGLNKKIILMYLLIILFILSRIFLFDKSNLSEFTNIVNPLFWIFVAIVAYFCSHSQIEKRKRVKFDVIQSTIIVLILYVMIYFSLGLIAGYERSPYSHELSVVIKNLWVFWAYIIFQEYVRSIMVKLSPKKIGWYVLVTFIFIVTEVLFSNAFSTTKNNAEFFKYISETLIPLIVTNCLFTYFAITAGQIPSMVYRSVMVFLTLLLPIYPKLNWLLESMIEIVLVIVIALYINYIDIRYSRAFTKRQVKKEKVTEYIPFVIVLVVLVCFISGTFKYQPISVLSNSMYPKFSRGDAVVIEKVSKTSLKKLKKGTIIYYGKEGRLIIHRIVSVEKDNDGKIHIVTKGDNNNGNDPWIVQEEDIQGIVKFMIPFIGYPSVLVNELLK